MIGTKYYASFVSTIQIPKNNNRVKKNNQLVKMAFYEEKLFFGIQKWFLSMLPQAPHARDEITHQLGGNPAGTWLSPSHNALSHWSAVYKPALHWLLF